MSAPGTKWNIVIPDIPFLSKYPRAQSAVRNGLFFASAFLVGYAFQYMDAHGFKNVYVQAALPLAIPAVLVSSLTYIWNIAIKNQTIHDAIEWVLEATNTGVVPMQLAAKATPVQLNKIEEAGKLPASREVIAQSKV